MAGLAGIDVRGSYLLRLLIGDRRNLPDVVDAVADPG